MKHQFRNTMKDVQTLSGADIDCDHNLLAAKICIRLKNILRFQKRKPRWDSETLCAQRLEGQDAPDKKLGAIECGSAVEQY